MYELESRGHQRVSFSLADVLVNLDDVVLIQANHNEYEGEPVRKGLKALVSSSTHIQLRAHPALVVMIHEGTKRIPRHDSYLVKAREIGESWTEEPATPLSPEGEAKLLARRASDWLVRIEDTQRNQIHRSTAIRIPADARRKTYAVDLSDEKAFPWTVARIHEFKEPRRILVPSDAFPWHGKDSGDGTPEWLSSSTVVGKWPAAGIFVYPLPVYPRTGATLLARSQYLVSYNTKLKLPNWVTYRIVYGKPVDFPRPRFPIYEELQEVRTATKQDYRGTGYDHGALVSAADMAILGEQAVREAYYLSVAAPQTHVLNRGAWAKIERQARQHVATTREPINVMAGPAFDKAFGFWDEHKVIAIGDGVAVPTHFFRVHWSWQNGRLDVLAFLVPNDSNLHSDTTR